MSRAAYMRDYRAKRKGPEPASGLDEARERIAVLEAEVARLKRELAERPAPLEYGGARYNTRTSSIGTDSWTPEFRPVQKPKKGK
jgi:hypothetical protein